MPKAISWLNIPLINYCHRWTLRHSILDFPESWSNDLRLTSQINLGACTIKESLVSEMKEKTQYHLIQCVNIDLRTIFANLMIGLFLIWWLMLDKTKYSSAMFLLANSNLALSNQISTTYLKRSLHSVRQNQSWNRVSGRFLFLLLW